VDETCCDWAQYKKIAGLFENITNPNYLKMDYGYQEGCQKKFYYTMVKALSRSGREKLISI